MSIFATFSLSHIALFLGHGGDLARHCYEFWELADFQLGSSLL